MHQNCLVAAAKSPASKDWGAQQAPPGLLRACEHPRACVRYGRRWGPPSASRPSTAADSAPWSGRAA